MVVTISWGALVGLLGAMVVLAALPSLSVVTVVGRSAAFGVRHGLLAAAGIVLGDLVWMSVALLGLGALAEFAAGPAALLRLAAAIYLLWLGQRLWRSPASTFVASAASPASTASAGASVALGFLLTLGDQKAVLFYLAFFPAFLDLAALTPVDLALVGSVTVVAVGGTKAVYAVLAHRLGSRVAGRWPRQLQRAAAAVLAAAGLWLLGSLVATLATGVG